jgi:hypothetical protein
MMDSTFSISSAVDLMMSTRVSESSCSLQALTAVIKKQKPVLMKEYR